MDNTTMQKDMNISGSLSQLLNRLDRDKISVKSFIGLPINDVNGNKIGSITYLDIDNDLWYGTVEYDIFKEKKESSIEINPESKYRKELIQDIKALGQEIIDRAEDIAGDNDLRTSLIITLTFEPNSTPTIECTSSYLSKRYFDNLSPFIPVSIAQSGISLNAIRESFGFEPNKK